MKLTVLAATISLFGGAASLQAMTVEPCVAYNAGDMAGAKSTEPSDQLTTMPAKNGSIFIANGYGVSVYPGQRYVGPATIVETNTYPGTLIGQYGYLLKPTANGHYINLVDLYENGPLGSFPTAGIGSFHCFKLGTPEVAGQAFPVHVFYNDQVFINGRISAHGSDKTVTLTNLNQQKLLTYRLDNPDDGSFKLVLNLDTGSLTLDRPSEHGYPASHKVTMPSEGVAYSAAIVGLSRYLDDGFGEFVAGHYPYAPLTEALVEVRNYLSQYSFSGQ